MRQIFRYLAIFVCSAVVAGYLVLYGLSKMPIEPINEKQKSASLPLQETSAKTDSPHVLLIVADDLGWKDVGFNGSEIKTPTIDELAGKGLSFNRFYVQPSCSPTRASLMTGMAPSNLGIYSPLSKLNPSGLPLDQHILPEYFKSAGYRTVMVGKWHLGYAQSEYLPTSRGFDHFYGNLTGGIGYWNHVHGGSLDWQRNSETLREDGYATHLSTAEAISQIKQRDPQQPLFLYLAYNAPHLPNEAPKESLEHYSHLNQPRQSHAAMVSELDNGIAKVVATLEEEGMLDNTLIWFLSDNGGLNSSSFTESENALANKFDNWFGEREIPIRFLEFARVNVLQGGSDNSPFRKGKQSVYEGGVRVPSFVYWKGRLAPGTMDNMMSVQDVLPTILNMVGVDAAAELSVDGVNRWPFKPNSQDYQRQPLLVHGRDGEAFYQYPWKLITLSSGEKELYHLDNDPFELDNKAPQHPEVVVSLTKLQDAIPRQPSIHVPVYRSAMDMDFFGGAEVNPPITEKISNREVVN